MGEGNIKSLTPRLERWLVAFERGELSAKVSNHGRLLLRIRDEHCTLSCTDMVQVVTGMVKAMAEHGFDPEPPPVDNDPVYMKVR
jgi:hypothetical protein